MAIVYCSECGKEVSERAPACPHCGNPQTSAAAPSVVIVKKNSHPVLIGLGVAAVVFVLLIVVVAILASKSGPPPSANFVPTDNITDTSCTQLTDYCVNVYCTYQNSGNAAGSRRVRAQLLDKASGEVRAARYFDLTLLPSATQRVTFSFPEAELDWEVSSVCKVDSD